MQAADIEGFEDIDPETIMGDNGAIREAWRQYLVTAACGPGNGKRLEEIEVAIHECDTGADLLARVERMSWTGRPVVRLR